MKHVNIPIFIPQLGCPHHCIYCNQKTISAQTTIPDDKQVQKQINCYLESIGSDVSEVEIAFFGGSFTCLPRKQQITYLEAVQPFLKHPKVSGIRLSTRPDYIDKEGLFLLKAYNVKVIELGIQSFADKVLKASGRFYSSELAVNACQLIQAERFRLGIQVMIGLPEATHEYDLMTAEIIAAIKPNMVRLYPTLIIRDTPLEHIYKHRKYKPLTLDEAVQTCADMKEIICRENIAIIRMGLQPNEELQNGEVIAGPFHPAFGELVEQMLFFRQAHDLLKEHYANSQPGQPLALIVNPKDISKLIGYKRKNIMMLSRTWKTSLAVKSCENLKKGSITLELRDI